MLTHAHAHTHTHTHTQPMKGEKTRGRQTVRTSKGLLLPRLPGFFLYWVSTCGPKHRVFCSFVTAPFIDTVFYVSFMFANQYWPWSVVPKSSGSFDVWAELGDPSQTGPTGPGSVVRARLGQQGRTGSSGPRSAAWAELGYLGQGRLPGPNWANRARLGSLGQGRPPGLNWANRAKLACRGQGRPPGLNWANRG